MDNVEKIIDIINSSVDLFCECKGEKQIQNILSRQLGWEVRRTLESEKYPKVEIDVFNKNYSIEIKYNRKYYSGINQLLIQKWLYNIENIILFHVHNYLNRKFINAFRELAEKIGFKGFLLDRRKRKLIMVNING
ncbi:MAG: hypothetical protein GF329_09090 [Candidatus Lokiarchaeota archaeon]|nr:hypothetical protein [Candidatus Lokiarchaeota archaeon]